MTGDIPTAPPAASAAIEAALLGYEAGWKEGKSGAQHSYALRCAIASYLAALPALPSEFGGLKKRLGRFSYASGAGWGLSEKLCADAISAITALEARLADARAEERRRCIEAADNKSVIAHNNTDAVYNLAIGHVIEAIRALAAKE